MVLFLTHVVCFFASVNVKGGKFSSAVESDERVDGMSEVRGSGEILRRGRRPAEKAELRLMRILAHGCSGLAAPADLLFKI